MFFEQKLFINFKCYFLIYLLASSTGVDQKIVTHVSEAF